MNTICLRPQSGIAVAGTLTKIAKDNIYYKIVPRGTCCKTCCLF